MASTRSLAKMLDTDMANNLVNFKELQDPPPPACEADATASLYFDGDSEDFPPFLAERCESGECYTDYMVTSHHALDRYCSGTTYCQVVKREFIPRILGEDYVLNIREIFKDKHFKFLDPTELSTKLCAATSIWRHLESLGNLQEFYERLNSEVGRRAAVLDDLKARRRLMKRQKRRAKSSHMWNQSADDGDDDFGAFLNQAWSDFLPSMPDINHNFTGAGEKFVDAFKNIADNGLNINMGFSDHPLYPSILELFSRKFNEGVDNFKWFIIAGSILVSVLVLRKPKWSVWKLFIPMLQAIISIVCQNNPLVSQVTALCASFQLYILSCSCVLEEAGYENEGVLDSPVKPIVTALMGLAHLSIFSKAISEKDVLKTLSNIGHLDRINTGVTFSVTWLTNLVNDVLSYWRAEGQYFSSERFPEIRQLADELDMLIEELKSGADYDFENFDRLLFIEKKLRSLSARCIGKDMVEEKNSIQAITRAIVPLRLKFERCNQFAKVRREPLGIMIGGPSGVGKSTMLIPLIINVSHQVTDKYRSDSISKNYNSQIWCFDPMNEFADAYTGQFNTIIDEAGQLIDTAGNPDFGLMSAIRMINSMNYPLHMAHLEDKGATNFKSELVWATTNRTMFKLNSLYSSEAYTRRFRVSYVHVPRVAYCTEATATDPNIWNRRLDTSKIKPMSENDPPDMSIHEFYPYNFLKGEVIGPPINYEQLTSIIVSTYLQQKEQQDALIAFHHSENQKAYQSRWENVNQGGSDTKLEQLDDIMFEYGLNMESDSEQIMQLWREIYHNKELVESPEMTRFEKVWIGFKNFVFRHPYISACAAALTLLTCLAPFIDQALGNESLDAKEKVKKKPTRHLRQKRVRPLANQAAAITQNHLDIAASVYNNNLYTYTIVGLKQQGYVLFVGGLMAVAPHHFYDKIATLVEKQGGAPIELSFSKLGSPGSSFKVFSNTIDFSSLDGDNKDLTFWQFPPALPLQKDIRKYFISEKNEIVKERFWGALLLNQPSGYALVSSYITPCADWVHEEYNETAGYSYTIKTTNGDCGLPLFLVDERQKIPYILGFHVAGNGYVSKSIPIFLEEIDEAWQILNFDILPDKDESLSDQFNVLEENVTPVAVTMPSQLRPSPFHGKLAEPKKCPAMLKPSVVGEVEIDPWELARSHYSGNFEAWNTELLDYCSKSYLSVLMKNSLHDDLWKPRILTFKEAVEGIEGVMRGVPRNKSPGYPWVLETKLPGKKDFFGEEGPYVYSSELCAKLISQVEEEIESLERCERPNYIYIDRLKDELREIKKYGFSRLYSAGPLNHLLICRMYFGDFVRWAISNRVANQMAVGVNPYSVEWDLIVKRLQRVGKKCIFGDYSKYDGSLPPIVMQQFLGIVEHFYRNSTEEERNVRKTLFLDVLNSKHLYVDPKNPQSACIYEWQGSNPSGTFLTTILNCVVNLIILRYAIMDILLEEQGGAALFSYKSTDFLDIQLEDNIECIVFGDDNGFCVSDEYAKVITQESMEKAFAKVGFKYTNENKDGKIYQHRVIEDCSFLKRAFRYDKTLYRYVAPLPISVIIEMLMWMKVNSPPNHMQVLIRTALLELTWHGEEVYNDYSHQIAKVANEELHLTLPFNSYEHAYRVAQSAEFEY